MKIWRSYAKKLEDVWSENEEIRYRLMFGGAGAYVAGRIFASLSDVGLALKFSSFQQGEILRVEGAKRLQYEPDAPVSMLYVVMPENMAPEDLKMWVERSVAYVRSQPEPGPRQERAKKSSASRHKKNTSRR